ncbi:MAG: pseudouridine synthase, partial [Primorskyibacter sp.]
ITSPALNVTATARIEVDGRPLEAAEPERLWLYNKPTGRVTTARDEQGRPTIYDDLPEDLPRVMPVGRLDLNSEGLLLLTNDGGIKRKLELPSTGWLRRYRVRVNGRPSDDTFAPLRQGLVVDGERFQPMSVTLDRQQGANAWLTVGLREGRNREIRRAMTDIGLNVNRLIRISYGPFQLGTLKSGEVEEVRRKVLRDQLGLDAGKPDGWAAGEAKSGGPKSGKPKPPRRDKPRIEGTGRPDRKPYGASDGKPSGKPSGKPGVRSKAASGAAFGQRSGAKPGVKPGSKLGPKPGSKPGPKSGTPSGFKQRPKRSR